jgi:multiple sugar transport system substrate-binding protein
MRARAYRTRRRGATVRPRGPSKGEKVERKRVRGNRRGVLLGAVVLASLVAAAAFATGGAAARQGRAAASGCPTVDPNNKTLNLILIPSPSADSIRKFIPKFEAKYPGVKVHVDMIDYGTAHQKELLSIRQHAGAWDVAQFDNTFLTPFGAGKLMTPLDACLKSSKAYDINDFSKGQRDYGKYNGTSYGLTLSTEPFIQWYRKDIYAKLGLKPAKTWAQFKSNAMKVKQSGLGDGVIMGWGANVDWWWWALCWSNGGHLYNAKFQPSVNSPACQKGADYLKSLLPYGPKGGISANGDDVTAKFLSGNIGAMINYSGYWGWTTDKTKNKNAGKIGTAKMPMGTTDITHLAGWNIGIPADAKNPGLAWKFLEFVLGKANAKAYLNSGAAAIGRKSITGNAALVKKYPYLKLLNIPSTSRIERYPQLVTFPEVDKAMVDALGNIMTGQTSTKSGLDALQKQLASILSNEQKQRGG